jgi:hypothetical protein
VTLQSIFDWLEAWPVSVGIRQSSWMFPAFESVHVIAITLVVGSVMVVDLRVLGLASLNRRITALSEEILPWTWGAFMVAVISGAFLFAAKAHTYFFNIEFQLKMALMLAAGLNMLVFHFASYRTVREWDLGRPAPVVARIGCGLSLTFWILVVAMGRWIGFSIEG